MATCQVSIIYFMRNDARKWRCWSAIFDFRETSNRTEIAPNISFSVENGPVVMKDLRAEAVWKSDREHPKVRWPTSVTAHTPSHDTTTPTHGTTAPTHRTTTPTHGTTAPTHGTTTPTHGTTARVLTRRKWNATAEVKCHGGTVLVSTMLFTVIP